MSNWDTFVDYFTGQIPEMGVPGGIPGSEYLWMIVIVAVSIFGFIVARRMVSKV